MKGDNTMAKFNTITDIEVLKLACDKLLDNIEEYELRNERYELALGETSKRYDRILAILNKQYSELHDYITKGGEN